MLAQCSVVRISTQIWHSLKRLVAAVLRSENQTLSSLQNVQLFPSIILDHSRRLQTSSRRNLQILKSSSSLRNGSTKEDLLPWEEALRMVCALGIEETLVAWLATLLRYLRNTISTSTLYHSLRFSSSCRTLDWTRKIIMNSRSYLRTICSSSKMRLVSKIADVSLLHSQLARKWTYLLLSSSLMTHLMEIQLSSVRLTCLAILSNTFHQSLSECLNRMSKRWKYLRQRLVMGAWEM